MKHRLGHKRIRSSREEGGPVKNTCIRDEPASVEKTLSNDLLQHVASYFVSEKGVVDGESLRSTALVSKRWKEVVYARSLWMIPAGLTSTGKQSAGNAIGSSLAIREVDETGESSVDSCIGFLKLERAFSSTSSVATSFRVLERATEQRCILSIAKDKRKTSEMLKELFHAHHVQQDAFLQPYCESTSFSTRSHRFPRGVRVGLDGKLIRWYDDVNDEDYVPNNTQLPLVSPREEVTANQVHVRLSKKLANQQLDQSIAHLLALERTADSIDSTQAHIRRDCWAKLVDWVVEIVECFGLDDHTAYRAMAYFHRFVSACEQGIKMSRYQLAAGSCLYSASKCGEQAIEVSDISFSADNVFNDEQLLAAEDIILRQLDWKLAFPTILDFVLAYARTLGLAENSRTFWMMRYMADLALQTSVYLTFQPSLVAASVVALSLYGLHEGNVWPESLVRETGLQWHDLEECTVAISRQVEEINLTLPDLMIVGRRYRKTSRRQVGELSIPSISSFSTLTAYRARHLRQESHTIPANG